MIQPRLWDHAVGSDWGVWEVRFPNAVPVNSQLRMHTSVTAIDDLADNGIKVTFSCTIEIKGQEKPACVAEFIAALFE